MKTYPFCSVIVLNYYGEKVLANTVNSLLNLDYPEDKYEIIIVDNNSKDKSLEIINKYSSAHKNIKAIFLDKNYGFSKGNNFGTKQAKGEYVALINNDCIAYKNWLKELVSAAETDNMVFAVNSKILLYPKFINVKFSVIPELIPIYAWLSKSKLYDYSDSELVYLPLSRKPTNAIMSYSYFEIEVPYEPVREKSMQFTILFNSRGFRFKREADLKNFITFENKSIRIVRVIMNGDDIECRVELKLFELSIRKASLDKIQNAGILVFQDGYARDIGAVVRNSQQFYEYDWKQYDQKKEIYAACGAAVLYNKKILDKIGYLDESFFMYYEDVEICERARFAGFKTIYNPKAVIRHYHALSSKEWSPFFTYHVEKGRLLHIFYNFPLKVFLKEYFYLFFFNLAVLLTIILKIRKFIYIVKSRKEAESKPKYARRIQIVRALVYFILYSPFLILRRANRSRIRESNGVSANYQKLLSGEWYFK